MTELLKQQQLFNLLKGDEILFQEFLENSKDSIVLINQDGIICEWNNTTEKITGTAKEDSVDKHLFELLKTLIPRLEYSQFLQQKTEKIISDRLSRTGNPFNTIYNLRIITKSGERKCLNTLITKFKKDGKSYLGLISEDITEKLKSSKQIKQNKKYLDTIFNNDAIGIGFCNLKGEFIKVNSKLLEITGYSEKEIFNLNINEITHPEDALIEKELCYKTIEEKKNKFSIEKRYIRKDGSHVWVKLNTFLQWSSDGTVDLIFGFVEDITLQKKAEDALKESEKKYRYVTEQATDIIYTVSLDSKITFYNNSIEKIFETTKDVIEKEHYDYLMLPQDKEFAKKLHADIYQGKKPPIFEHGFKTPKGKLVYLECSVTPLFDDNENVIGALGIARDITDKRIVQEELKESKVKLENSVKTKDRFLSVIAHDLRDPFNILIGYSDLILDQFDSLSKEEIKKYVQAINNSSNNGYNLLKNLLDWSRNESDRIVYTPERVNLSQLIDFTIHSLKYAALAKNIKIRSNYENDFFVNIDENLLKTVLRNIISNAIKFSYKNSDIVVEINEEKVQYIINVIDSGIGISDENKSKIFSPDMNFSQKGTTNEKGTGLGLIICKEFINKWKGRIWLESTFGEGSIFSFSIPK